MLDFGSEELVPFFNAEFPALVIDVTPRGDTYLYTWQEQTWDPVSGQKFPMIGGRSGMANLNPAVETNNQLLPTFPVSVKMKLRGGVGQTLYFEFLAPGGAADTINAIITAGPTSCAALAVTGLTGTSSPLGSQNLTGISSTDAARIEPGMLVVGGPFPGGTIVTSINQSAGTAVFSAGNTSAGTFTFGVTPYCYSWAEVTYDAITAAPSILSGGRSGDATTAPAFAENFTLTQIGTYVLLRPRDTASGLPTWTFRTIKITSPGVNLTVSQINGDTFVLGTATAPVFPTITLPDSGSPPAAPPSGDIILYQIGGIVYYETSGSVIYPLGLSVDDSAIVLEPASLTTGVGHLRFDSNYFVAFTDSITSTQADVTLFLTVQYASNTPNLATGPTVEPWNVLSFDQNFFTVKEETGNVLQADVTLANSCGSGTNNPDNAGANPVTPYNKISFDSTFFKVRPETGSPRTADVTFIGGGAFSSSAEQTLAAAGNAQGNAAAITANNVLVTGAAAGPIPGVILPAIAGAVVWLLCDGAPSGNEIKVYPPVGEYIHGLAVNQGFAVTTGATYMFSRYPVDFSGARPWTFVLLN